MKDIGREINWVQYSEEQRELHEYYRSLGYDERTAAVLALFTFGQIGRKGAVRIDRLYEALLGRGYAYLDDDPVPRGFGYANPSSAPQRTGFADSASAPQRTGYADSASAPQRTRPSSFAQRRKLSVDACAAPMPKAARSRKLSALSSSGRTGIIYRR